MNDRAAGLHVFAPGRVNLIGDHVDYVDGLVLPMAVDLGTTIVLKPTGDGEGDHRGAIELSSRSESERVVIELPVDDGSRGDELPAWGRFVAAVTAELKPAQGISGVVSSTLPLGSGLSSSTSFTVAVALALGFDGAPLDLAMLAKRAEITATGVPCGSMDQIAITHGVENRALLIDCRDDTVTPVALPDGVVAHAVPSGITRRLAGSAYAERRTACEEAEAIIGPLRDADASDLATITDPVMRARARHVITEIERVEAAVGAAAAGDATAIGALMNESHESLRLDFEVSVPELDQLVAHLRTLPGVYGARLTGAGFGGCAVALVDETVAAESVGGWRLKAGGPARVRVGDRE